jgi:hypothetical protein
MPEAVKQYNLQRAELLAELVLTRRKDVQVGRMGQHHDAGIDLVARVNHPVMNGAILPHFGIEVNGTTEALDDEQAATRYAKRHHERDLKGLWFCPIVLFLFSMEGDQGYYSWLLEPAVSKERTPSLTKVAHLEMNKISKKSIDDLIEQVVEWFNVMAEMVGAHSLAKK